MWKAREGAAAPQVRYKLPAFHEIIDRAVDLQERAGRGMETTTPGIRRRGSFSRRNAPLLTVDQTPAGSRKQSMLSEAGSALMDDSAWLSADVISVKVDDAPRPPSPLPVTLNESPMIQRLVVPHFN
jgi:hypothetical protein